MSFKSLCVIPSLVILLLQLSHQAVAQEGTSQWVRPKPVARKVITTPKAAPEKETRGEVMSTEYELEWPSIKTHQRAFLTISGNNVRWTQEFVDGDAPMFTPIVEGIEEGTYIFRVEYISNDAGKAKKELKAAFAKRRDLLDKRLELMRQGDRDGAKAALDQANGIRSAQAAKPTPYLQQILKGSNTDSISRTGIFVVKADGKVSIQAAKSGRDDSSNRRSGKEAENNEY